MPSSSIELHLHPFNGVLTKGARYRDILIFNTTLEVKEQNRQEYLGFYARAELKLILKHNPVNYIIVIRPCTAWGLSES